MNKSDTDVTVQELKNLVVQFRDERGWRKHHQPKNLAMSICIEAAELLEHFQWDELGEKDKAEIADELADVLINCVNFADIMDIDIASSFADKLERAKKKYPVSIFNPERGGGTSDDYITVKRAYRAQKGKSV